MRTRRQGQGSCVGSTVADLLDAETSSDDAGRSKSHPDILRTILEKLGSLAPSYDIVDDDTPCGTQAATKAGIRTIGLLRGGWSEAELMSSGCIAVYSDPCELLARYAASPLAKA